MEFLKSKISLIVGVLFLFGLAAIQLGIPQYREYQVRKSTNDFFADTESTATQK